VSPDRGTAGLKRQPYTEQEVNAAIEALVNDVRVLKADLDRSEDNVARLIVERDEARMKLSDMHRRAQAAEAAVYEKLPDPKTGPVTLGRMLATAAYHREAEAREKAEAERDAARALLRGLRDWLADEKLNTWPYMEGPGFYDDKETWVHCLNTSL
jgi:hypothetical protein